MNCKPKSFYGNAGDIGLMRWFNKMEYVFQSNYCAEDSKVRFATCTLLNSALSWWNEQVKTMGIIPANSLSWGDLKAMMVEEYCPRDEIQNL